MHVSVTQEWSKVLVTHLPQTFGPVYGPFLDAKPQATSHSFTTKCYAVPFLPARARQAVQSARHTIVPTPLNNKHV